MLALLLCSLFSGVTSQRFEEFQGVGGVDKNGDVYLYNSQLTDYWVKVQPDNVKITKAERSPIDGMLYGLEQSGIIYSKKSFSDSFSYVLCCATAFTFVEDIRGLPNNVRLLQVDRNRIDALRDFNDQFLSIDTDKDIVSIASVNGQVAAVTADGRLYRVEFHNGARFEDLTRNLPSKFDDIVSIDSWKSAGKFLAVNTQGDVWSSSDLIYWESFGNGRSCCMTSVFEIEDTASFSEQTFPFCTQTNVQDVRVINNGLCETRKEAFGQTVYSAMSVDRPCVHYINSSVTELSAQDKFGDYKIAISAKFDSYPASRIGIAFNFQDEDHFDYIFISPNERDCYGMGHMIPTGPIDRVINNVGCPGGAPLAGDLFTLEVQTVAGQVIVKYDGYTIFSRYPFYPNLAAGGLFVWPVEEQSSSVITQGFGVCYVPKDGVSLQDIFGGGDTATSTPYNPESEPAPTSDGYSEPGQDVTESTLPYTESTELPSVNPVTEHYPVKEVPTTEFSNTIEDNKEGSDARIELLSEGIQYIYYLYKENKGFTAANKACERLGMQLLLIEDAVQNDRISELLRDMNVDMVWLGKFWIENWVITLNDGTQIDWQNFDKTPRTTNSPIFAAIRSDGLWDAVEGGNRFNYICQKAYQLELSNIESNEVKKITSTADDTEILGSFEEGLDHPPVIITGPVNITARVGDTVTFECIASSRPPATVIIVKLDDENAEVPPIGDANNLNDESTRVTTRIELEAVTKEDAGKYLCVAQNSLGSASEAAWLIIADSPIKERKMCSLWGDPHIQTYDGNTFNFPGICTYVLSMDCVSSSFWIYGMFSECGGGGRNGPSLSAMESLTIYYRAKNGNHTGIELQRGWVVNIGGSKLRIGEGMAAHHTNLAIQRTAEHLIVTLPNKIVIQWDGLHMGFLILPDDFPEDRTCGMCGRYNNDMSRDYYMKHGRTDITTNPLEFGNSWKYTNTYRPCYDVSPRDDVDPCDYFPERKSEGQVLCQQHLYQVPFTSCHATVDPALYFQNCVRDWCGSEWRRSQKLPLCNALGAYATTCELKGVPISSWRSSDLCPIDEIKEITMEEGCPWNELEYDFELDPQE